jgi:large subunit ribosomal protein L29
MAKKANKKKDVAQLVTEDLVAAIKSESAALDNLKFNHAVTTLGNPASIRAKRREVARLHTELTKRKNETKA